MLTRRLTLFLSCVVGLFGSTLLAQFPSRAYNPEVVQLAPRNLQRFLTEGQKALEEERYSDGIDLLSLLTGVEDVRVAADIRGQDYFLENEITRNPPKYYRKTMRQRALSLLGNMSAKGRDVLEIQFGVTARQQLDAAIASGDRKSLHEVLRLYAATDAGFEAQLIVAEQWLSGGSPLAAAQLYRELLSYKAARAKYGVELVRAACQCWMAGGKNPLAVESFLEGARLFPGQTIQLGGQPIVLEDGQNAPQIIETASQADRSKDGRTRSGDWQIAGGTPARNSVKNISMPLRDMSWPVRTHSSVPEGNALRNQEMIYREQRQALLPKSEVRAIGDTLLVKTNAGLILGVNMATGLTKWQYPLWGGKSAASMAEEPSWRRGSDSGVAPLIRNRVWGSDAFGKFSCDDEQFYYVTEAQAQRTQQAFSTYRFFSPNQLQAVNIAEEGAIKWRVGTPEGDEQLAHNDLLDVSFLGPPLPYDGELFCVVEQRGEIRLIVLDSETGAVNWSQQLCSPFQSRGGNVRNSVAISPTISDGVILCPTGANAFVAVDLVTRGLRWMINYQGVSVGDQRNGLLGRSTFEPSTAARWQENTLIATDGLAVMPTVEGGSLHVRDLMTGMPHYVRSRQQGLYVLGVEDNRLYVLNADALICLDMGNSRVLWRAAFPDSKQLAGRGLWLEDSVMVPLTNNTLLQISKAGEILESKQLSSPLGNLFVHQGNLLSVSATVVTAFQSVDNLREALRLRLAEDAGSPETICQRAQLKYAMGDTRAAVDILKQHYQGKQTDALLRSFLVDFVLAGLEEDFEAYYDTAVAFREAFESHPKRDQFLRTMAIGSINEWKVMEAFDNLMTLFQRHLQMASQGASRERIRVSANHYVAESAWIKAALHRNYLQANAEQRKSMDKEIAARVAGADQLVLSLRLLKLRCFAWHPAAESILLDSAVDLVLNSKVDASLQTQAEQILVELRSSPREAVALEARKLLGRLTLEDYAMFGPYENNLLDFKSARDNPLGSATSKSLFESKPWNTGLFQLLDQHQVVYVPRGGYLNTVSERFGRPEIKVKLSADELLLTDQNGRVFEKLRFDRASADNESRFHRAKIIGGLLMLQTSSEVLAFDLYRGRYDSRNALLWRQSLQSARIDANQSFSENPQRIRETAFGEPILKTRANRVAAIGPVTSGGLILHRGDTLSCVNLYTGREQWSKSGYPTPVTLATKGKELAVVNRAAGTVEFLDSTDGTEERGRRNKIEPGWEQWTAQGVYVVDFQEGESAKVTEEAGLTSAGSYSPAFKIWSPWDDKPLLETAMLPISSKATICEDRYVCIADQTGKLHIVDLKNGVQRAFDVPIDDQLEAISAMRFGSKLIVSSQMPRTDEEKRVVDFENEMTAQLAMTNGNVYCIDLDSLELAWEKPARLLNMFAPLRQPRGAPFLFSFRINPSETPGEKSLTLGFLDLRNGKMAYVMQSKTLSPATARATHAFQMEYSPDSQTISVILRDQIFTFLCNPGPRPPRPVARFGRVSVEESEPGLFGAP